MYSNQVWTIVDAPEGVKPIGCKWIYKRKRDRWKGENLQDPISGEGLYPERRLRLRRDFLASGHNKIYQDYLIHCRHMDYEI